MELARSFAFAQQTFPQDQEGCTVLDLGIENTACIPALLDSCLAWFHYLCISLVQVKRGESDFPMTQMHRAGHLPASAVSFQLPASLGRE